MFKKLGVQLYTVRDFMNTPEEVRDTFRKLKAMGYDEGQTAGAKIPYDQYAAIAREEGIDLVGTHESLQRMIDDFPAALAIQKVLNDCPVMGTGGGGLMPTVADAEKKIAQMNEICAKLKPLNMLFSYHNHSHEFLKLENGKTAFEMICDGLDKETGTICLDTFWVQNGGGDVRYWIDRLAGRIEILHLKDMKKSMHENDWFKTYYCEIGQGNLYWEGIMDSAEKAGVKHYVVEQDIAEDPFKSLAISSEYLHKNFMN